MAEESPAYNKQVEGYFTELFRPIPGAEKIDWDAFGKAFDEKVKKGAEITVEDCLPAEGWQAFNELMRMEENGHVVDEKDIPFSVEVTATGNTFAMVHRLREQSDEETVKALSEVIKATYENDLSLGYLKVYMDEFGEAGVNKSDIKMTLQILNADGTVIEEAAYTYADLEAAAGKSILSLYTSLFSVVLKPETVDLAAFIKGYEEKVASGAKIVMEDCLPANAWNLLNVLMRMDDYSGYITSEEDLPYTVTFTAGGNHLKAVHQLRVQTDEETANVLVADTRADFENSFALGILKESIDKLQSPGLNPVDVTMDVQYLNADGSVLYEASFTYADLAAAVDAAGAK